MIWETKMCTLYVCTCEGDTALLVPCLADVMTCAISLLLMHTVINSCDSQSRLPSLACPITRPTL